MANEKKEKVNDTEAAAAQEAPAEKTAPTHTDYYQALVSIVQNLPEAAEDGTRVSNEKQNLIAQLAALHESHSKLLKLLG